MLRLAPWGARRILRRPRGSASARRISGEGPIMKSAVFKGVTVVLCAATLSGCVALSTREHRGYVMDEQLTSAVQVGTDNKTVGRKDAWANRPSPGRSTRTTGIMWGAIPARSPSAIRRTTDQTVLHIRFDPAGNVASVEQTDEKLIASIRPEQGQDPDAWPRARLLRGAVQQYRHDQPAGPSGKPEAVSFLRARALRITASA